MRIRLFWNWNFLLCILHFTISMGCDSLSMQAVKNVVNRFKMKHLFLNMPETDEDKRRHKIAANL